MEGGRNGGRDGGERGGGPWGCKWPRWRQSLGVQGQLLLPRDGSVLLKGGTNGGAWALKGGGAWVLKRGSVWVLKGARASVSKGGSNSRVAQVEWVEVEPPSSRDGRPAQAREWDDELRPILRRDLLNLTSTLSALRRRPDSPLAGPGRSHAPRSLPSHNA